MTQEEMMQQILAELAQHYYDYNDAAIHDGFMGNFGEYLFGFSYLEHQPKSLRETK